MSHQLDGDFEGTFPYPAGFVHGATSGATSCAISRGRTPLYLVEDRPDAITAAIEEFLRTL